MANKDLTPKQKLVLDYIKRYSKKHGHTPTQEAITKGLGFRSVGTINYHLQGLKEQGYLEETEKNAKYGIQLKTKDNQLPLLGKVAAGNPIDFRISNESIEVPSSFIKGNKEHFVLQASGNSMIDAHILDGDLLIIRKQESADNGQIVVAEINNEATIKRFFKKSSSVELHPENENYKIIKVSNDSDDFRIEGILVGVLSPRS
ncbi:transcriptional repressor LexA [bacterium]|nr:transcriptional repressor LexA [bacterium]